MAQTTPTDAPTGATNTNPHGIPWHEFQYPCANSVEDLKNVYYTGIHNPRFTKATDDIITHLNDLAKAGEPVTFSVISKTELDADPFCAVAAWNNGNETKFVVFSPRLVGMTGDGDTAVSMYPSSKFVCYGIPHDLASEMHDFRIMLKMQTSGYDTEEMVCIAPNTLFNTQVTRGRQSRNAVVVGTEDAFMLQTTVSIADFTTDCPIMERMKSNMKKIFEDAAGVTSFTPISYFIKVQNEMPTGDSATAFHLMQNFEEMFKEDVLPASNALQRKRRAAQEETVAKRNKSFVDSISKGESVNMCTDNATHTLGLVNVNQTAGFPETISLLGNQTLVQSIRQDMHNNRDHGALGALFMTSLGMKRPRMHLFMQNNFNGMRILTNRIDVIPPSMTGSLDEVPESILLDEVPKSTLLDEVPESTLLDEAPRRKKRNLGGSIPEAVPASSVAQASGGDIGPVVLPRAPARNVSSVGWASVAAPGDLEIPWAIRFDELVLKTGYEQQQSPVPFVTESESTVLMFDLTVIGFVQIAWVFRILADVNSPPFRFKHPLRTDLSFCEQEHVDMGKKMVQSVFSVISLIKHGICGNRVVDSIRLRPSSSITGDHVDVVCTLHAFIPSGEDMHTICDQTKLYFTWA